MSWKRRGLVIATLIAGAHSAHADDDPALKLRGFGTIGVNHSSQSNADYVTLPNQPSGSGRSRGLDWANESRIGVQADWRLSDTLSVSVQALAEHRYDHSFSPDLQTANLRWQATPSTSLRVGRMSLGLYMVSDYQKVGYSLPWVHGPLEVYQTSAISNFDGADITYKTSLGDAAVSLNGYTGLAGIRQGDTYTYTHGRGAVGGVLVIESGYSTYRVGYSQSTEATTDSPTLQNVFALANSLFVAGTPGVTNSGAQYAVYHHRKAFMGIGYSYDPGDWFLMTEMIRLAGDNDIFGLHKAAYVTAGYRINDVTPYASLSRQIRDSPLETGNPVTDALYALGPTNGGRHTASLGLRWNFMNNADFKLQYDRTTLDSGSTGMFIKLAVPPAQLDRNTNVFTATFDFVF